MATTSDTSDTTRIAKEEASRLDREPRTSPLQFGSEELFVLSLPIGLPPKIARKLSPSEIDVLEKVLDGLSNAAIAEARNRHPRTVANQLASAYRKLGIGSRNELIGLVGPGAEISE